jgi:hypothetical protein
MHLLQDSFSLEHAYRTEEDGYQRVRGIKTYLCTLHSDQHSHAYPLAVSQFFDSRTYSTNGDVIWRSQLPEWSPANVKLNAVTALEATKETWALFIAANNAPPAQREALANQYAADIAAHWMSFDANAVIARYDGPDASKIPTYVTDQKACDQTIGGGDVLGKIAHDRAMCVYQVVPVDGATERDVHLHIPFRWGWRSTFWKTPPRDYDPTREPPTSYQQMLTAKTAKDEKPADPNATLPPPPKGLPRAALPPPAPAPKPPAVPAKPKSGAPKGAPAPKARPGQ